MELWEANHQASKIVDDERRHLSVRYHAAGSTPGLPHAVFSIAPFPYDWLRDRRPREIRENPAATVFVSDKYELLRQLWNELSPKDRLLFSGNLARRIEDPNSFLHKPGDILKAGTASQSASELPLIAEFLVRSEATQLFLRSLRRAAAGPGLTLMLMQLEDMIAFNFTIFTTEEYDELESALLTVQQCVVDLKARAAPIATRDKNTVHHVSKEVVNLLEPLREATRRAKFLYVQRNLRASKREVVQEMSTVPANTIATSAPTLSELQQLPRNQQAFLLLKRLAHLYPKGQSFARSNLALDSHLGPDPYGLVTGYPPDMQRAAIKHLLGVPWQELEREHFIFATATGQGFVEITEDGWAELDKGISVQVPNRAVLDALLFLHSDFQGYAHYFREMKLKEVVAAAFTRVENRLNEIRDSVVNAPPIAASGTGLPYRLYDGGVLNFPYPSLGASNSQSRSAYEQSCRG